MMMTGMIDDHSDNCRSQSIQFYQPIDLRAVAKTCSRLSEVIILILTSIVIFDVLDQIHYPLTSHFHICARTNS